MEIEISWYFARYHGCVLKGNRNEDNVDVSGADGVMA